MEEDLLTEQSQRDAAAAPLALYERGLLTLADLVAELTDILDAS